MAERVDVAALRLLRDRGWIDDRDHCVWLLNQLPAILAALERAEQDRLAVSRLLSGEAIHKMATALALAEQRAERRGEALSDLYGSLHSEDGNPFEEYDEEGWLQFSAAYAQAGVVLAEEASDG